MTEPTPQPAAPQPAAPLTEAEDKQWASFAHFGGILGFLPSLIIFLVFKDRGALTKQESKEALNWQITWTATYIVLFIISTIVSVAMAGMIFNNFGLYSLVTGFFGFLVFLPWLINVVLSIIGGVKVNGGGSYRYPVSIRLIK
ncbi:MAG TPA: DUF4870 domain-containing protein [Terrimesophilobacter sp.]|nr:DUF4870 domain-containing protein [Terrimesophilobacter sp.]HRP99975.1 DUF4870 domain-containing protein [Terrimesophilobacter sp.]